jgi:hypothetical protein
VVSGSEQYDCYSVSGGGCPLLASAVFGNVTPNTDTADRFLELHFSAKAPLLAVNQSLEIQGAFFVPSYAAFTQSNDYSFRASNDFQSAPQVTLYADGVLIWGTEPKR